MKKPGWAWQKYLLILAMVISVAFPVHKEAEAATANETTAYTFLTDNMGLSPAAACGIMSNISTESGFQPNIYGLGGAYGICQWTGSRQSRLKSWCNSNGFNYTTLTGQLYFLQYELRAYYPQVNSYLRTVANTSAGAYNAGFYWCYYFERPANTYATACYRGSKAQSSYWNSMGSSSAYLTADVIAGGIKLNWNKVGNHGYQVRRASKSTGTYKVIATLGSSAKSYTDRNVTIGKKYYYYVEPLTAKGKASGRSNKISCAMQRSLKDSECTIKLSRTSYTYNGKAKKPKVTVRYEGKKLTANKDYYVSYSSNIQAGTAYVRVSGMGVYSGTKKLSFAIKKADQKIETASIKTVMKKTPVEISAAVKGNAKIKYSVEASQVVTVKNGKLILQAPGMTYLTVKASATRNYRSAEKKVSVTVLPSKPVITKLTADKDGTVKIKWSGEDGLDGCQIQYVVGSGFKKKPKTVELSAEKIGVVQIASLQAGKTYSFRVRSYVTVSGKRRYGSWSEVKRLTILK